MQINDITNEHLILLRALLKDVRLDGEYETVPYFDAKRPYGNSDWQTDVGELLGYEKSQVINSEDEEDSEFTDEQIQHFETLQQELPWVLKILVNQFQASN